MQGDWGRGKVKGRGGGGGKEHGSVRATVGRTGRTPTRNGKKSNHAPQTMGAKLALLPPVAHSCLEPGIHGRVRGRGTMQVNL